MSSIEYLERLLQDYKISCTVPRHPKKCIVCGSKVSVFQINFFEAIFMCSNYNCIWPLETHEPEDILGQWFLTFCKILHFLKDFWPQIRFPQKI